MFYWVTKNFFKILFTLYHRVQVRGKGQCSVAGACILAANHASHLDPPLVGAMYPRRLSFIAAEYLFRIPLLGFCIRRLGAIPVSREDAASPVEMMKMSLQLLKEGRQILLFPEGSRSQNGKLQPLEGGVAMLSLKTGAPIIPIYVKGTHKAMPRGAFFPRPVRLGIVFGEPLYPQDIPEELSGKAKREYLVCELEKGIRHLRDTWRP